MVGCNVTFNPPSLEEIPEGKTESVKLSLSCESDASYIFNLTSADPEIAVVVDNTEIYLEAYANQVTNSNFTVEALLFGRSEIVFDTNALSGSQPLSVPDYDLSVTRGNTGLDIAFAVVLAGIILIYNFSFGCKIHLSLALQIVKRPIGPFVGFLCQFCLMPPLAFGIGQLFDLDDIYGMGLLAMGSCPGGGGSNVLAYMLSADLELSIMMTFMSTILALGMTPLWIWSLGRFYTDDSPRTEIPVVNVFASLLVVIVPVALGVALKHKNARYGAKVATLLRPFTGLVGFAFITLGTATYFYALQRATWKMFLACLMLSGLGYIIAFTLGKMITRNTKKAVTISLETGFQNLALAILMLGVSLPQPESTMAGTIPIIYTFMSAPLPVLAFLAVITHRKIKTGKWTKPDESEEDKDTEQLENVNGDANAIAMNNRSKKDKKGAKSPSENSANINFSYSEDLSDDDTSVPYQTPMQSPTNSHVSNGLHDDEKYKTPAHIPSQNHNHCNGSEKRDVEIILSPTHDSLVTTAVANSDNKHIVSVHL